MIGEGTYSTTQRRHTCVLSNFVGNWKSWTSRAIKPLSGTRRHSSLGRIEDHALDMRVNVEGRRAQKTYEGLVAVAGELDRKT